LDESILYLRKYFFSSKQEKIITQYGIKTSFLMPANSGSVPGIGRELIMAEGSISIFINDLPSLVKSNIRLI